MSELKRVIEEHQKCPCCNSGDIAAGSVIASFREEIFIKCKSCNFEVRINKEYGWEELLKRWNTRKPIERIVERLEEYRDDFMNDIYEELREDADNCRANRIIDRFDEAIEIVKEGGINERI